VSDPVVAPGSNGGAEADAADEGPSRRAVLLQLGVFAAVGFVFNIVYFGLYLLLRDETSYQVANAISLVLSTMAGTAGHRRVTFGVRGPTRAVQHQALGLTMLGFGLVVTAGSLSLLQATAESPSRPAELAVLVAANLFVGLVRFLAFRSAMVPASPPT
jgi:putative flippase GtrA